MSVTLDVKLFNSLFAFCDLRLRADKIQQPNAIILKLKLNLFHYCYSRIRNKIKLPKFNKNDNLNHLTNSRINSKLNTYF